MKKKTLVVGVLATTFMAFIAVFMTGQAWAYAWLLAEFVLGTVRLGILMTFEKAEADGKVGNAIAPVVAGLIWVFVLAAAYYQCVASGEWLLILLAGIGVAGVIGGVSSRNAGTPHYGIVVMSLVALPYSLAALLSPIPYLFIIGLQIPLCLGGMILVLLENYKILLGLNHAEHENRRLAHHDLLTGLPNRIMKQKRFEELLHAPRRVLGAEAPLFTVFGLDLDGFKDVNDRFGHATGDAVLAAVATRLRHCVRGVDFLCRTGGDEFVILLPAISSAEAAAIARRIIKCISEPFDLGQVSLRIGISIGSACAPHDGMTADELLRSADRAMYEAKRRGKGLFISHSAFTAQIIELAPAADADARAADLRSEMTEIAPFRAGAPNLNAR